MCHSKGMTEGSPNLCWWLLLSAIPIGRNDSGILEFLCERAWPFWGTPLEPECMQVLPHPTGVHLVETGRADVAPILLKRGGQPWEVLWLDILPSDLFYPYSKSEPLTTCSPGSYGVLTILLRSPASLPLCKALWFHFLVALVQGTHPFDQYFPNCVPRNISLKHFSIIKYVWETCTLSHLGEVTMRTNMLKALRSPAKK